MASRIGICLALAWAGTCAAQSDEQNVDPEPKNESLLLDQFQVGVKTEPVGGLSSDMIAQPSMDDDAGDGEWFVAPIPFRSPQIGFGIVGIGGYIFKLPGNSEDTPASMLALGGMYSENGSWGGFVGGRFHFGDDDWRLRGGLASANIRYDYFGIGSKPGENNPSLPFETEFSGFMVDTTFRVAPKWYLGPTLDVGKVQSSIRTGATPPPELRPEEFETSDNALGAHLEWDTRNDQIDATAGHLFDIKAKFQNDLWGSSFNYGSLDAAYNSYHTVHEGGVFAWRVLGQTRSSGTPFYDLARYDLRGYVPGQYIDRNMFGVEAEYRFHIWERLGGVAFANAGQVFSSVGRISSENLLPAVGTGIRIRLTEDNNLNYSIDVAYGRDGLQYYFSIGESF